MFNEIIYKSGLGFNNAFGLFLVGIFVLIYYIYKGIVLLFSDKIFNIVMKPR